MAEAAREHAPQTSVQTTASWTGYNTASSYLPIHFLRQSKLMLTSRMKSAPPGIDGWFPNSNTDFKRFPFSNFTYCLTLFSKFFSSFPHGTCLLSVSCLYLALDGIYHQLWAAFPNNPTLWKCIVVRQRLDHGRDSHPLWRPIPRDFYPDCRRKHLYKLQFSEEITNLSYSRFIRHY
jgi:hypothetical protein